MPMRACVRAAVWPVTASQMPDQLTEINDVQRCTDMFPEHPLAAKARPAFLVQRRVLVQALAGFA